MWDPTFEERIDEDGAIWGDEIPFDGAPCPGTDAEALPFPEWVAIYREEPWALEEAWEWWEEAA
jgi:hypothetical protein